MNRRGFTLLELIVVLVVLAALVAIALPQYIGFVEKSKAAEAMANIGAIKTGEVAFALANSTGNYKPSATTITITADLGITVPNARWNYAATADGSTSFTVTATRLGADNPGTALGSTIAIQYWNNGFSNWVGNHPGAPKS